jgi:quercetin dioxygenase-like cupin family protein
MSKAHLSRRSLCKSLFAFPIALAAQSQLISPSPGIAKVAAGADRFNNAIKLPGGDLVYVKVAALDSGGAFFMTEQPIERRGVGPPKHYHEAQDEWFYCLAGEYLVEIGDKRFRLAAGDSVLGPRRVPHAFVYDSIGPGRLLVGFTPAGHIEEFFRDLERRGHYFGTGTPEDKEIARQKYGIVNVGPPLIL